MNILILNYEYPPLGGGGAAVSKDLAEAYAARGHSVTILTMGYTGLPAEENIHGVHIIRLKCLRSHMHSSLPHEHLTFIISAVSFLRKYLKDHHYDVCHAHFIFPTGPIALMIRQLFGIPYVITAHGSDVPGHNKKFYVKLIHFILWPFWKKIVREAAAVISPSPYLLKLMQKAMPGDHYVLIPNGIEAEKYKSDQMIKERRILLMGRMQPFKNFQVVLHAAALIPESAWGDWHLDILGDGPYRTELENMTDRLNIRNRVSFHGWIDDTSPDHLSYLRRAAVYVSASRFENSPISVIEAMAAGCYPLLSDIEGHRQFFQTIGDKAIYFFQPDNAEELAAKLEKVIQSAPAALFRSFDTSACSIDKCTDSYLELMGNCCLKRQNKKEA